MTDTVTILTGRGPRLAKRWTASGIEGYERAKRFTYQEHPVADIRELSALLRRLEADDQSCVIRGRPRPGAPYTVTRDLETFEETPHRWVCLDVDSHELPEGIDLVRAPVAAVDHFVQTQLPAEFRAASYHWQLSNSAGAPGKERTLKAHLWFWLSAPRTGEELDRWARATKAPVDITVFRTVQVHYTSAPVLDPGVSCPIATRSGFVVGLLGDEVDLVVPDEPPEERQRRAGRQEMVDPTEKPGLIGLFCRLYPPARAVDELLAGHFEWEGDSDTRLTWLQGGGAAGGAVITDDELHIYNSHSTDPLEGRAANVWDLCQVHLFGGLDPDGRSDLSDKSLPSHQAMRQFAKELPDVKAELHTLRPSAAQEWAALEYDEGYAGDEDDEEDKPARAADTTAGHADALAQYRRGRLEHLDMLRQGISGCQDVEALKAFCRDSLADDEDLDDADRDGVLRPAVQQRWTELTGNRLRADLARKMVDPPRAASNAGAGGPDWLGRWCYVAELDRFHGHDRKVALSVRAFDAVHSQRMPLSQDNLHRERASDFAINVWGIETVDNAAYGPGKGEVFEALGRRWANTYREDSVPVAATGDGTVVRMVESHIKRMVPDDRERALLLSWLAHNVQRPGVKIRWAPYIFGDEGVGKTFLAELLSWTMGASNVRILSGATLKSDFTGWTSGAAVVAVEEVYQAGHLFDTAEKLKAPISNDVVDVHRKGKDSFPAPNFSNYLLLSNHPDGMPIGSGNRRLFFLSTALGEAEAKALSSEGYFTSLFDTCRENAGELRSWLLGVEMHPEFDPNGRAPTTVARDTVIELSRGGDEIVLMDAIGDAKAFRADWAAAVLKAAGAEVPKTRAWNALVAKLGFDPVSRRVKVRGTFTRLYARKGLGAESTEALLAATPRSAVTDFDGMDDE